MKLPYQLFDALLEPCYVLNQDLRIVYCNETAAQQCGLTVRKAQRTTFREALSFSEPIEWLENISTVTDATPYKEIHFKNNDGAEGKVQITCQEIPSGTEERNWVVFVRDVTLEERLQNKYRGELEQKEGYILELQKAQAELEKYSKNLEVMVEERTAEVRKLNRLMAALLDSLGEGFFVFGKDGQCFDFSSKACETILEGRPNNRPAWEVLKFPENKVEGFKKWMMTLFAEMLPFEDLAPLGPDRYPHTQGRHVKLEYAPLMNEGGMEGIVVVASDITSLVEAQREAESERENARLILNLVNKKAQISRFVRETRIIIRGLNEFLAADHSRWDVEEIFRALHTIKGGCASYNVAPTAQAAHQAENRLMQYREDPTAEKADALRVQTSYVSGTFEAFLTETRRIFGPVAFAEERFVEVPVAEIQSLCQTLALTPLGRPMADDWRRRYVFEPIRNFFEPFNDVLLKVAQSEGKNVKPLAMAGGDLEVLPEAYSTLFSTFVHAFRNAVDHGIEAPPERRELGKPEAGTVRVELSHVDSSLRVVVQDDGGGINPSKIRARLAGKGIETSHESDEQVIQHVFDSSFSTKDVVTETSGRGVGMDAIRFAAQELGGTCVVTSELGVGTRLVVEVPWIEVPAAAIKKAA